MVGVEMLGRLSLIMLIFTSIFRSCFVSIVGQGQSNKDTNNKGKIRPIYSLVLIGLIFGIFLVGVVSADCWSDVDDPHPICSCDDLQNIDTQLSWDYELQNDIDFSLCDASYTSGAGFNPIGDCTNKFAGSFDGMGYKIKDLFINRPTTDCVGLFGDTTSAASIKNIGLISVDVSGDRNVGGLVGIYKGSSPLTDCYSTGTVTGDYGVGGLVSYVLRPGSIVNSYSTAHVNGRTFVGGLAGYARGDIINSCATGNVAATSQDVGGLVSWSADDIRDSYATGHVSGSARVGGLIGEVWGQGVGSVINCYATGSVSGGSYVGGVLGTMIVPPLAAESDNFWDTSGYGSSVIGIGKTTAQMRQQATFTNWDFTDVWNIDEGTSYPYLRSIGVVSGADINYAASVNGGSAWWTWYHAAHNLGHTGAAANIIDENPGTYVRVYAQNGHPATRIIWANVTLQQPTYINYIRRRLQHGRVVEIKVKQNGIWSSPVSTDPINGWVTVNGPWEDVEEISFYLYSTGDGYSYLYEIEAWGSVKPTVVTNLATDIDVSSATLNGDVTDDGGNTITERGFYFGENLNPSTKYTVSGTTGSYSLPLIGLDNGKTYYFKAFATNIVGESNGSVLSFTTLYEDVPPVTTITPDGTVGWVNADVGFTLTCTDPEPASGCKESYYNTIDSEDLCPARAYGYTAGTTGMVTCPDGSVCRKKVCYYSEDNDGNKETIKNSEIFYIDKEAPNTSIRCNGADCVTDWYTSDVTVNLICDDGLGSGCSQTKYCVDQENSCTPGIVYTGPFDVITQGGIEGINYLRFNSIDNMGNDEAVNNITIKIDKTDPVFVSYAVANCDYRDETQPDKICWVKQGTTTTHTIEHTDAISTPSIQYLTFTKDGCTPNACGCDWGEMCASGNETKSRVYVDSGNFEDMMWNNYLDITGATCVGVCTGTSSKLNWTVFIGTTDGKFKVLTYLYDEARRGTGYEYVDWWLDIDNAPPSTTHALDGTEGLDGWYRSDVTVTLTCSDGVSSGCNETEYCVDQTPAAPCIPNITYSGPFDITAEGYNYLRFNSTDNVGNVETTNSRLVKIDKTPPDIWINDLPQWTNTSSFEVRWNNRSDISGIASFQIQWKVEGGVWTDWVTGEVSGLTTPGYATFGAPPGNDPYNLIDNQIYFLRINATDKAGNIGEWSSEVNIIIDVTLPVCTMNPLLEYSPEIFQISWSGDDSGGSGIDFYDVQFNPESFGWINAFGAAGEGPVASYSLEEGDGKIATDGSGNGHDGTVYGNTKLLMHFDEDEGAAAYDESAYDNTVLLMHFDEGSGSVAGDRSRYGNTGSIYGNTKLLMRFDEGSGNPGDSSPYNNDGINNGATWETSGCQSGSCLEFDGDHVEISDNSDFNDFNTAFSVSAWAKPTSWDPSHNTIVGQETGFLLAIDSSGNLANWIHAGGSWTKDTSSNPAIPLDTWTHFALTYDGSTIRSYINGVLQGSGTSKTGDMGTGNLVYIGKRDSGTLQPFHGSIDEVGIYSKALSQEEIDALHNEGKAKFIEYVPGKSGNALEFDGEDDYVEIPDDSSLRFTSASDVSIVFWAKLEDDAGWIIHNRDDPGGTAYWQIELRPDGNVWSQWRTGATSHIAQSTTSVTDGGWHHMAVVYRGSETNTIIYIDGEFEDEATSSISGNLYESNTLKMGGYNTEWVNGTIDEVAIYNRALSQEEIQVHYAEGRAKFAPKQGRIYGNTRLLMRFDEGSGNPKDSSSYGNDGTITGATWTSDCQSGNCPEFDGVDDWIDVPTTIADNADGTISLWVYIDSSESDNAYIWMTSNDGCGTGYKYLRYNFLSSKISANYYDGSYKYIVSDTVIDKDRWHHLVYSWGSAGQHLYQDGELVAVNTDNTGQGYAALDHFIGGWGDCSGVGSQYFLDGKIDEVAIYSKSLSQVEVEALNASGRAKFSEWVDGKSGSALEFDGLDDYVDTTYNEDMNTDFSLGAWIKIDSLAPASFGTVIGVVEGIGSSIIEIIYDHPNDGDVSVLIRDSAATPAVVEATADNNYVIGKWHHVFLVRNSFENKLYVYLDGVGKGVDDTTTDSFPVSGRPYYMGARNSMGTANYYFNGTIDEVAIYSRALSQEEINAMYNEGRAKFTDWVPGKYGNALEFDGVDDYVSIYDSASLSPTADLTIEAWIYPIQSKRVVIVDKRDDRANNAGASWDFLLMDDQQIRLNLYEDATTSSTSLDSAGTVTLNQWNHVAVVYDYVTSGTSIVKLYINGVEDSNSWSNVVGPIQDTDTSITIGYRNYASFEDYFNGTIDEVRIYNRTLSGTEILEHATGMPETGFCSQTGTTNATCRGLHGANYAFMCRATDHAKNTGDYDCDEGTPTGSTGDLSGCVNTTIDTELSGTTQMMPYPTKKWINSTDPDDILVKIKWLTTDWGSYVNCSYVMWKNCTHLADSINNGTCSSWGEWYYVMDHLTGMSTNCLTAINCTGPRGGLVTCYGEVLFNGTGINATGGVVPGDIGELEIYNFSIWAEDEVGNVEEHSLSDPIIDASYPTVEYDVLDDTGGSIKDKPFVRARETSTVRISSNATDTYSGIEINNIKYYLTQRDTREFNVVECGSAPEWDGYSYCDTENIAYGEDIVIKYWIEAKDWAGNIVVTEVSYIATHQMVNFIIHSLYMTLGDSFDLDVQVRNLQPVFDNITLTIIAPSNYVMTTFLDTGVGTLDGSGTGYVLEDIGLNPNEEKIVKIRVMSSNIGPEAGENPYIYVNATSMLNATGGLCESQAGGEGECLKDSDDAMIVVGYPAAFPGLSWWAMVILVMLAVIIYGGIGTGKEHKM